MPPTFPVPRDPDRIAPPRFTCRHAAVGGASQVTVSGELDLATAPCLERALHSAEVRPALVVLDLRDVEFLDCAGAYLLVATDRRIRSEGGRFVIVIRPGGTVDRLLALTGAGRELELTELLPVARSPVAA